MEVPKVTTHIVEIAFCLPVKFLCSLIGTSVASCDIARTTRSDLISYFVSASLFKRLYHIEYRVTYAGTEVNCIYTIIDFFMKNDNRVMELIYQVTYQDFKFGISSAMSWIYFGIALAFIGVSSFIISKAVKSYE